MSKPSLIKRAVIIAATSSLGTALCHKLAARGCSLILCGGDEEALSHLANDLAIRHRVPVEWIVTAFNAEQRDDTLSYEQFAQQTDGCDSIFILSDDAVLATHDASESLARATKRYYTVPATLMTVLAAHFTAQKAGRLVLVSSLVDERGAFRSPHYTSARQALLHYSKALKAHYAKEPISITTVHLGVVDTPLWYGTRLPYGLTKRLIISRERAAAAIIKAAQSARSVVNVPASTRIAPLLRHGIIQALPLWEKLVQDGKVQDPAAVQSQQPWLPGLTPQGSASPDPAYYFPVEAPAPTTESTAHKIDEPA